MWFLCAHCVAIIWLSSDYDSILKNDIVNNKTHQSDTSHVFHENQRCNTLDFAAAHGHVIRMNEIFSRATAGAVTWKLKTQSTWDQENWRKVEKATVPTKDN